MLSPRSVRYPLDEIAQALAALAKAVQNQPSIALARGLVSTVVSAQSGAFDPQAVVAAVEAECGRIHGDLFDTYIDHRRQAPVPPVEPLWTTL